MKNRKLSKILGIGLSLMLALSLGLVFTAAQVAADDDEWSAYDTPVGGADGDYFMDDTIADGPMHLTRDIDGYFWAYVDIGGVQIVKSLDTEGRTWEITEYANDIVEQVVVAIVTSTIDADVVYVAQADGAGVSEVYKTEDGGDSWAQVGDFVAVNAALEDITCMAVGWDDDDDPRVFIGTDAGEVWYMYDVAFGADWTDLTLTAAAADATGVFGISVSPDFTDDAFQAVLAIKGADSYLAYHVGSDPGGWDDVLIQDDTGGATCTSTEGSDPVFPTDFNGDDFYDEDTEIFVSITGDLHAAGLGGVVRVYGVDAGDYEILDDVNDDLISLASVGSLGNMQFLAGADGDNDIWYSWDDGDDWLQASAEGIEPAGAGDTYVVMDADFDEDAGIGWAAVDGGEGGVHMTIDGGTSSQGVGLLDTDITNLRAAEVVVSSPETVYIVTDDASGATSEVFRYDAADETWDRIYEENTQYNGLGVMDMIGVYGDTIVLADFGTLDMTFSSDGGQTFAEPDEEPGAGNLIRSLLVLDDETWWVGDDDGALNVTDDAGDRTWDEYEIDANNDDITSFDVRGDEALAGNADGEIFYSEDDGETWDIVGAQIDAGNQATYVCFDVGNDVPEFAYAVSDDTIARFQYLHTDLEEDWETADIGTDVFTGIGCMGGVPYASSNNVYVAATVGGMARAVNPLEDYDDWDATDIDRMEEGLIGGTTQFDGGMLISSGSNVLWGIDIGEETLWVYTDLMVGPPTGIMADPGDLDFTISLDGFDNATDYEFAVYSDEDMRAVYRVFDANTADDEPLLMLANLDVIDIDNADGDDDPTTGTEVVDIDAGAQLWVMVRANAPVHSKWSAVFTFSTDPGGVGIDEDTLAPQLGATGVPVNTPFSWGFDEDADSYLIEISDTADFSSIIDSATVTMPIYESGITLNEGTSYWFRVYAIAGGQMGNPAYSNFTTLTVPAAPPVPPAPAAAPEITIPPVQQITPNWIYAIIGIGVGLAVLVAVLLGKSRKS